MAIKWWDGVENLEFDIESIDYRKYLNCPDCKKVALYCPEHRKEVEILIIKSSKQVQINHSR